MYPYKFEYIEKTKKKEIIPQGSKWFIVHGTNPTSSARDLKRWNGTIHSGQSTASCTTFETMSLS